MACGQREDRFWLLTLREIAIIMKGVHKAQLHEQQMLMWGAWHTAFFTAYAPQKSAKFWKLDKVMPGAKKPRPQTAQEQIAMAQQWTKAIARMQRLPDQG